MQSLHAARLLLFVLLSTPLLSQDRAQAVSELERCIKDYSVEGGNCNNHTLAKVLQLYLHGDKSVLPLILRAYVIQYSGADTDPGEVYLQLFDRDREELLSALDAIPQEDKQQACEAFAETVGSSTESRLSGIRELLTAIPESSPLFSVATKLLYEVDLRNAYRLRQYFPPGTFRGIYEGRDRSIQRWYAQNLFALREESLFSEQLAPGSAVYRFLWLRSFHNPVSVRLRVFPDGRGVATLKVSDGAGGYNPGSLAEQKEVPVSAEDVAVFLAKLEQGAHFWDLPTEPPENCSKDSCTVGVDGARWIWEANSEGRYHIVDRWSPDKGEYRAAAMFLLRKVGYSVPKDHTY